MDTKEANEKFYELAAGLTCIANIMDSSGMRVAIELMDPEAEETMNSILLKAYHPVATLVPQLPTVSGLTGNFRGRGNSTYCNTRTPTSRG